MITHKLSRPYNGYHHSNGDHDSNGSGDDQSTRGKIAVHTLKEITRLTNGELIQPKQLLDLAKFYENAAHSLVYDLGTKEVFDYEDEEEDEEDEEEMNYE